MRLLILLLPIVFLVSCNSGETRRSSNEKDQLVVEEFYSNGRLKSKKIFYDREKGDYLFYSYYSDGRLKDSARYVHDTVDGLKKAYESGTGLTHFETYRTGILHGVHKALYDNGVSSFEGYRLNGQKVGEWLFHYPDGRLITYEYYDSLGTIRFFRKYDEKENLLKQNGNAIIGVFPENDDPSGTGMVSGIAEVAFPPGCSAELKVGEKAGERLVSDTLFPVKSNLVQYNYRIRGEGMEELGFELFITEKSTGDSYRFTAAFKLTNKQE